MPGTEQVVQMELLSTIWNYVDSMANSKNMRSFFCQAYKIITVSPKWTADMLVQWIKVPHKKKTHTTVLEQATNPPRQCKKKKKKEKQ